MMNRAEFVELARGLVLRALDEAAAEIFGAPRGSTFINGQGWKDSDLPDLFKAIDRHAENIYSRYEATPVPDAYEVAP